MTHAAPVTSDPIDFSDDDTPWFCILPADRLDDDHICRLVARGEDTRPLRQIRL